MVSDRASNDPMQSNHGGKRRQQITAEAVLTEMGKDKRDESKCALSADINPLYHEEASQRRLEKGVMGPSKT